MKKIFTLALFAMTAMFAWAEEKTDVIPGSLVLTAEYVQQVLECESGAAWIVALKNDGNGPQFKPGSGGIVTKTSIGKVRKVSVEWGSKSNESVVVYGSHEPIASPLDLSAGTELGTVSFSAGATTSLDIEGDWEYIGMTATAVKGKACQFVSMSVTWSTAGGEQEADPQEGIVINEVCGNDGTADDGTEDWIELANPTAKAIALEGVQLVLTDDKGEETVLCTYGKDDVLDAGAYLLCKRMVQFEAGIPHSKNIIVKLVSAKGKTLSKFDKRAALTDNGHHNKGGSYSRIPDMTGDWAAVQNCTPGAANDATPIGQLLDTFFCVPSNYDLCDGLRFILVAKYLDEATEEEQYFAMSSSWSTTKDGAVYQLAEKCSVTGPDPVFTYKLPETYVDINRVAVCTLESAGEGKWAIRFGETNNYKNEERYLACESFKNLDFKKSIDKKGVACTITINENKQAEISYGELAGSLKFNYKGDGTDRFLNYDPADKPDEHLAVYIFASNISLPIGIENVNADAANAAAFYNLNGQRVLNPSNGIFIKNGKKMIVK